MDPVSPIEQTQTPILVPNKKYVLLAVAVVAVIVLFVIITVITSTTVKKPAVTSGTVRQTNNNPGSKNDDNSNSVENTPVAEKWRTYKNSLFSIDYPADWIVEEVTLSTGKAVTMKPSSLTKDKYIPSISIAVESISSASSSLTQRQQIYKYLGFKSDTVQLDNQTATRLMGTFPPVKPGAVNIPFNQEAHIFMDKTVYSYLLVYKYSGKVVNPESEKNFERMVSSFKVIQP